jgi:hypothetical protein
MPICEKCGRNYYAGDGTWDDGDYLCGECLAIEVDKAMKKEDRQRGKPNNEPNEK